MPVIRRTIVSAGLASMLLLAACGGGDDTAGTAATNAAVTTAAADAATGTTAAAADASTATTAAAATDTTAASSGSTTDATPAIVAAASAFLATLTDAEKAAVQFDFSDTGQRQNWSNLPEGLYTRSGLMWGDMSSASQEAWLQVMQATLSEDGYTQVMGEWAADDALAASGSSGPGGMQLGQAYYWVAIIGAPSETDAWQWQWGGHHVTVNATVAGTEVALTPSFIGVQPATFDASGAEVRPLGDIEAAAFALVQSLDATQADTAILGSQIIDLVLGPGEDGRTIESEGLAGSAMTDEQKALLLELIGHYGNLVNAEDGAKRMAELEAELDDTYLAWYGPTTEGSGIYFRITGPSIVVEYSGQQMGGDASDHVHGIYRDPTNDYGAELGVGI